MPGLSWPSRDDNVSDEDDFSDKDDDDFSEDDFSDEDYDNVSDEDDEDDDDIEENFRTKTTLWSSSSDDYYD